MPLLAALLLASALVDHHQHLLSPAAAPLMNAALPAIELPPDIARLVAAREANWNDKAKLAELYTGDALVLSVRAPGWLRGREAAAAYLSTIFKAPFRITPVRWQNGELSGYLTRSDWHFGYVYLRIADGNIAVEIPTIPGPSRFAPFGGAELVKSMDAAGIRRSIVLSNALFFESAEAVRAENDWTAAEAAKFPDRLVAFCSFDPLADYALSEIEHCAGRFAGVKLHFYESHVDLKNPAHVAKLREVFAAANRHRLPLLVHTNGNAEIFARDLATAAPDVLILVAHLGAAQTISPEALLAFAAAPNISFEISGAVDIVKGREELTKIAAAMRRIGMKRFYFGSDGPDYLDARELGHVWPQFRTRMPLTEAEFAVIAKNVAPFLR